MTDPPSDDLDQWLLGDDARGWLEEAAGTNESVLKLTGHLRKHLAADEARRVVELVELRRRAKHKFVAAEQMFFTRLGLEQATDQWIAEYKARRFAAMHRVADLCCGVGGDAMALAAVAGELFGYDRSPQMAGFAKRNLEIAGPQATPRVDRADVAALDMREFDAWHIDPDRRVSGRRTTHAELHEPNDAVIDQLLAANPNAAIKLAPACEVPPRWTDAGELEWISRGGECKQLVVWQGSLASAQGVRRATLLAPAGDSVKVVRTLVGTDHEPAAGSQIDRYLYEPDAAVLASGLVGDLAAEHGWWTFASTTGYLTGPALVAEPACTAFEVLDVVPLQTKKLSRYLRARGIGNVEIKHRAVDVSPDRMRRELKLSGDGQGTLLLTRVGEKRIAIIARRCG